MRGRASADDLHGWYEAATLFVHPTLYEGSSIVTLEAMAHRRPVVASRAGGLPDKVDPRRDGLACAARQRRSAVCGDRKSARAIRRGSTAMGAAGRALVEKDFSWRAATDRLLSLYGELLAQRNSL